MVDAKIADYMTRLIAGIRKQIKNDPDEIKNRELYGEDCISSRWVDASLLCSTVEKHILGDCGPWRAGSNRKEFFVESDNFDHDVRLTISGDFVSDEDHWSYAEWLANALNNCTEE